MKRKISLVLLLIFVCSSTMGFTSIPASQPLTQEQQKNITMGISSSMVDSLSSIIKDYKAYMNNEITAFSLINTSTTVDIDIENLKMFVDYIDPKITIQEYRLLLDNNKNVIEGIRRLIKLSEDSYINDKVYLIEYTEIIKSFSNDYLPISNFMTKTLTDEIKQLELKKQQQNQ